MARLESGFETDLRALSICSLDLDSLAQSLWLLARTNFDIRLRLPWVSCIESTCVAYLFRDDVLNSP